MYWFNWFTKAGWGLGRRGWVSIGSRGAECGLVQVGCGIVHNGKRWAWLVLMGWVQITKDGCELVQRGWVRIASQKLGADWFTRGELELVRKALKTKYVIAQVPSTRYQRCATRCTSFNPFPDYQESMGDIWL